MFQLGFFAFGCALLTAHFWPQRQASAAMHGHHATLACQMHTDEGQVWLDAMLR